MQRQLTAIIEREGSGYVSLCPEVDIASQGDSIEEARDNLREAIELFFETASAEEIKQRVHNEVFVTRLETEPIGVKSRLSTIFALFCSSATESSDLFESSHGGVFVPD